MTEPTQLIETQSEATLSQEGETEYVSLVSPNFIEIMYDVEKYLHAGYGISQDRYPFFNFFLYEVHLERNNTTVTRMKERQAAFQAGRDVMTKAKRQEIMKEARKHIGKNKKEETADES